MSGALNRPRLLGMTTSAFDPASRFRFVQFIPHLERSGWSVCHCPNVPDRQWSSPLRSRVTRAVHHRLGRALMKWNRWRDLASADRFDAVFVNRDLAGRGLLFQRQLLRKNRQVIFDFDDAIYLGRDENSVRLMCEQAAWVTPGNSALADYARRYTQRVTVIPTVIDTELYTPAVQRSEGVVRVGWSGSDQSIQHTLFPHLGMLAELQREIPFELVIISNTRPEVEETGLRWSFRRWSIEDEVSGLQSLDIGLMPLLDDEFQRGKCGLKALQYMATGRPVLASPVGVNREIIEHGRTGMLASTPKEWREAFQLLVSSPTRRMEMGQIGRRRVVEDYSIARWLPVFLDVLEKARRDGRG
jgi:glycosyltransferase involved in cell wall biosynthesis